MVLSFPIPKKRAVPCPPHHVQSRQMVGFGQWPEELRRFVLSSVDHVLSNFACGDLGDADLVGDGVGGSVLALRTSRH
jgi:hypothetical protein